MRSRKARGEVPEESSLEITARPRALPPPTPVAALIVPLPTLWIQRLAAPAKLSRHTAPLCFFLLSSSVLPTFRFFLAYSRMCTVVRQRAFESQFPNDSKDSVSRDCQNSKHFERRSIDQNRWKSGKSWKSCKFSSAETLDSRSSLRYLKTLGDLESLESLGSLGGVWLSILWIYEIEFDALKLLKVLKVLEILDFQVFTFTE